MSVYLHNIEDHIFYAEMLGGLSEYQGTKAEHEHFFIIAVDFIDKISKFVY